MVEDLADAIVNLDDELADSMANLEDSVATALINDLANDLANPQQAYEDLDPNLAALVGDIVVGDLEDALNLADQAVSEISTYSDAALDQDTYLRIHNRELADLCTLLGLGSVSHNASTCPPRRPCSSPWH